MNASAAARAAGSVAIRVVARESTPKPRRRAHRARRSWVIATAAAEGAEEANDPTQTPSGPAAVTFGIRAELDYGEALIVVGGAKELGSWEPESGFALTWSDGNVWQGDLATLTNDAPENSVHSTAVEFKLVVVKPDWGGYWWEEGENRLIDMELIRTGCEVSGAFGGSRQGERRRGRRDPGCGFRTPDARAEGGAESRGERAGIPGSGYAAGSSSSGAAAASSGRTLHRERAADGSISRTRRRGRDPAPARDGDPQDQPAPAPASRHEGVAGRWPRVEVAQGQGPGARQDGGGS